MLNLLLQNANRGRSVFSIFRHLGSFGLFFLAILDSSPAPTVGGPDILLVILVSTHRNPWYEYAAVATIGSTIGAYITFRLARKAEAAYLESKFGQTRVSGLRLAPGRAKALGRRFHGGCTWPGSRTEPASKRLTVARRLGSTRA